MGPALYGDALATTEWFGPLVATAPISDLSQAIEVNNWVPYGLSGAGAIYARNLGSAIHRRMPRTGIQPGAADRDLKGIPVSRSIDRFAVVLVPVAAMLWGSDTLFRIPLLAHLSSSSLIASTQLVFAETVILTVVVYL